MQVMNVIRNRTPVTVAIVLVEVTWTPASRRLLSVTLCSPPRRGVRGACACPAPGAPPPPAPPKRPPRGRPGARRWSPAVCCPPPPHRAAGSPPCPQLAPPPPAPPQSP